MNRFVYSECSKIVGGLGCFPDQNKPYSDPSNLNDCINCRNKKLCLNICHYDNAGAIAMCKNYMRHHANRRNENAFRGAPYVQYQVPNMHQPYIAPPPYRPLHDVNELLARQSCTSEIPNLLTYSEYVAAVHRIQSATLNLRPVPAAPIMIAPVAPTVTASVAPTAAPIVAVAPTVTAPVAPTVTAPVAPTVTAPIAPTVTAPVAPTVTAPVAPSVAYTVQDPEPTIFKDTVATMASRMATLIKNATAPEIQSVQGEKRQRAEEKQAEAIVESGYDAEINIGSDSDGDSISDASSNFTMTKPKRQRIKKGSKPLSHQCPHCSKSFAKLHGLSIHVGTAHKVKPIQTDKPVQCQFCMCMCKSERGLGIHRGRSPECKEQYEQSVYQFRQAMRTAKTSV
jgi:hypothetical protein